MEPENEPVDVDLDVEEEEEESEPEATPTTDWEARAKKLEEKAIAQRERTRALKVEMAKLKKAQEKKDEPKTGELDNADYAFLTAKGIEEDEDVAFIHKNMLKWGMNLRDVLKDEDVQTKLKSMKIEREMKAATPGASKRASAGSIDNLEYWIAKYDRTGELPPDFTLQSAVINAKVDRENTNKPAWH